MEYSNFRTKQEDFLEHYRHGAEPMPHHQPRPRVPPVANRKTRKSHTRYLIFINRAPIICYSKRQQTVETSSFLSEFIALKACTEAIVSLGFKIRMFGIPMVARHATKVLCDNESVFTNSYKVESVLNKNHNSLAYHYVCCAVDARIITVEWITGNENIADVFTERLSETVQDYLFGNWCNYKVVVKLYLLYNHHSKEPSYYSPKSRN